MLCIPVVLAARESSRMAAVEHGCSEVEAQKQVMINREPYLRNEVEAQKQVMIDRESISPDEWEQCET